MTSKVNSKTVEELKQILYKANALRESIVMEEKRALENEYVEGIKKLLNESLDVLAAGDSITYRVKKNVERERYDYIFKLLKDSGYKIEEHLWYDYNDGKSDGCEAYATSEVTGITIELQ